MFSEMRKCLKLTKYSDTSILPSIFFLLTFLLAGFYILMTTELAYIGCTLITLAPTMLAHYFIALSTIECVAASPRKRLLATYLPNFLLILNTLLAYAILNITVGLMNDPASTFYSIYSKSELVEIYFAGIFMIFACVIMIPVIYRYSLIGVIITTGVLASLHLLVNVLLGSFIINRIKLTASYTTYCILGLIITLAALILTIRFKWIVKFAKIFGLNLTLNSKKRNTTAKSSLKWIIAITIVCIIAGLAIYSYLDKQNADGAYNYAYLKKQYRELMTDCDEQLEMCGLKITLDKKYYDAVTKDGCCRLKIEAPEDVNLTEHIETNDLGFEIDVPNPKYHVGSTNHYEIIDTVVASINAPGIIDTTYEISGKRPNIAYVYIYLNLLPENDDEICIRFYEDDNYAKWREEYLEVYFDENEEKQYPELECSYISLGNESDCKEFDIDGIKVAVSNTSLIVFDQNKVDKLGLQMKNELTSICDSEDNIAEGVEKYETNDYTKFIFAESISISDLSNVILECSESTEAAEDNITYVSSANSHLKKTIEYEYDKENSFVYVTMNFEWTQMPKYREIDVIKIDWPGLKWLNEDSYIDSFIEDFDRSLCKVTKTMHQNSDSANDSHLDEKELSVIREFNNPSSVLIPDKYDIGYNEMYIFPEICEDTSSDTYISQRITVELVLLYDVFDYLCGFPRIQCSYYHNTTDLSNEFVHDSVYDYYKKTSPAQLIGREFLQKITVE